MTFSQFIKNLFRSDGYTDGPLEVLHVLKGPGNTHGLTLASIEYMTREARAEGKCDAAIAIGLGVSESVIRSIK